MHYTNLLRLIRPAILSLVLTVIVYTGHAQESNVDSLEIDLGAALASIFDTRISMDIDTTFFIPQSNSFYMAEAYQSLIMVIVAPQTFDKAEEHFNKESGKAGFKLTAKGKLQQDGKTILYQKGTIKEKGKKMAFHMYAVEGDTKSTIFLTGMFMPGDEALIAPQIEKAALTARLGD